MVNRVMPASFNDTDNNKDSKIENKLLDAIGASQGDAPDLQGARQDESVGATVAKTRYMEHPGLQLSDPSVETSPTTSRERPGPPPPAEARRASGTGWWWRRWLCL